MAFKTKSTLPGADELGVSPDELEKLQSGAEGEAADLDIDIDFEAGGTQDYPSGIYDARLEGVEKKIAASGNTMLVWRFRTLKDKRVFWVNTVLTRDAMWKVTETAVSCGAKGEGTTKINVKGLINALCRLVIVQGTYEGATRPEVKKVLAPTAQTIENADLG